MIDAVIRKLHRQTQTPSAPPQPNTTYVEPGNQWYYPAVAGPSSYLPDVVGAAPVRAAAKSLDGLSSDSYLEFVKKFYRVGLETFGDNAVRSYSTTSRINHTPISPVLGAIFSSVTRISPDIRSLRSGLESGSRFGLDNLE